MFESSVKVRVNKDGEEVIFFFKKEQWQNQEHCHAAMHEDHPSSGLRPSMERIVMKGYDVWLCRCGLRVTTPDYVTKAQLHAKFRQFRRA